MPTLQEATNPLFRASPPETGQQSPSFGAQQPAAEMCHQTLTNYYNFGHFSQINCYFYHIQDDQPAGNGNSATAASTGGSSLQKVHNYDILIRQKLDADYGITDVITYVAKREICVFQLRTDSATTTEDREAGFNQLKDAIDAIISENSIELKLLSASIIDASSIFRGSRTPTVQILQKRPVSIIYLSLLRAVKCYVIYKLSSYHTLFEGATHELALDMVPFGNQMLVSSTINTATEPIRHRKKLVGYSILRINPSLNIHNDLLINMATSKKLFYKLSDFLSIHCNGNPELLDRRHSYVAYMCPSGVRCSFANGSFSASICAEPPSHETLASLLQTYSDIDPSETVGNWIRLVPSVSHVNGLTQNISHYVDSPPVADNKYIVWPVQLCFIQFATDAKVKGDDSSFEVSDPFDIAEEMIDLEDEEEEASEVEATEVKLEPKSEMVPEVTEIPEVSQVSVAAPEVKPELNEPKVTPKSETVAPEVPQINLPTSEPVTDANMEEDNDVDAEGDAEGDWDELFGESDDEGSGDIEDDIDADIDAEIDSEFNTGGDADVATGADVEADSNAAIEADNEGDDEDEDQEDGEGTAERITPPASEKESPVVLSPRTSPLYEDPGAPSPLSFPIIAPATPDSQVESERLESAGLSPTESSKSIFAPLNFNPRIKTDIDSKYSSGGKFFVRDASDSGSDVPAFLRDTPSMKRRFEDDLISDSDDAAELGSSLHDKHEYHNVGSRPDELEDEEDEEDEDEEDIDAEQAHELDNADEFNAGGDNAEGEDDEDDDDDDDDDDDVVVADDDDEIGTFDGTGRNYSLMDTSGSGLLASPVPAQAALFGQMPDADNWIFWILRGPSTSTIPMHFLSTQKLQLPKKKLNAALNILQELVLYSQYDLSSRELNSLIQRRESPAMPGFDIEFVLQQTFPGVEKIRLVEMLDRGAEHDLQDENEKPYECLFGLNPIKERTPEGKADMSLQFDDPSFSTATPSMAQQTTALTPQPRIVSETKQMPVKTLDVTQESLFHIPPTVLNLRRLGRKLRINQACLEFWRVLGLETAEGKKDFRVLFVVPKSDNDFFSLRTTEFIDSVSQAYSACDLGEIKKAGILQIETGISKEEYWANAKKTLLANSANLQTDDTPLLLMFAMPYRDTISLLQLSLVCAEFEDSLEADGANHHKRRKKERPECKFPVFFKAVSLDTFYPNSQARLTFESVPKLNLLALRLYNMCPSPELKNRKPLVTIAGEPVNKIYFSLTKQPIAASLIPDELFLHVCYERSLDRKWCVASWTDQYGRIGQTRSWRVEADNGGFAEVADEIFGTTLQYVSKHSGKSYVILARLNNMIPDDELTEWKRLSLSNNRLSLIVLTIEPESSALVLSNNSGPALRKRGDALVPMGSATPFGMTPAGGAGGSVGGGGGGGFSGLGIHTATPYEMTSPVEAAHSHYQTQHLQSLIDGANGFAGPSTPAAPTPGGTIAAGSPASGSLTDPIILDISDECYGLIFQVSQPLSQQTVRLPLRTGFLVNTGSGACKNRVMEVNLLSCQSGINSLDLLKRLLHQFKNLSVCAPYYGVFPATRRCGNVTPKEIVVTEEDDLLNEEDPATGYPSAAPLSTADSNSGPFGSMPAAGGSNSMSTLLKSRQRPFNLHQPPLPPAQTQQQQQQQPMQLQTPNTQQNYHQVYKEQKRVQRGRKEEEGLMDYEEHPVVPAHIMAVRKMLDLVVHIDVD